MVLEAHGWFGRYARGTNPFHRVQGGRAVKSGAAFDPPGPIDMAPFDAFYIGPRAAGFNGP